MKLFVTDIDDTLSVGETVSEEVKDACVRLKEAGWDIMIATGRTFGTARKHIEAAGATQPAILYDGSRTMTVQGKEIHGSLFERPLAEKVLDFLWPLPLEIQISGDETIHCRESDRETALFYKKAGVPVHYVTTPFSAGPIYRIGLWVKPEELASMEKKLKLAFDEHLEVTPGGAEFLDILPKGVSKGSALDRFISTLPSRPEIIVAAGDHKNDLAMLQYADIAAAPRNAVEALLSVADIVMPKASEHGIRTLVNHILSPEFQKNKTNRPLYL